jgi:hypoxanthine-guanine phosphoribosyltransferase
MNVLFDRATIQARIAYIAKEITTKHHKDETPLVFICLLSQHEPTEGLGEYFIDSFRYGFEINDEWVVGYGMDREDGTGRNIPGILAI